MASPNVKLEEIAADFAGSLQRVINESSSAQNKKILDALHDIKDRIGLLERNVRRISYDMRRNLSEDRGLEEIRTKIRLAAAHNNRARAHNSRITSESEFLMEMHDPVTNEKILGVPVDALMIRCLDEGELDRILELIGEHSSNDSQRTKATKLLHWMGFPYPPSCVCKQSPGQ